MDSHDPWYWTMILNHVTSESTNLEVWSPVQLDTQCSKRSNTIYMPGHKPPEIDSWSSRIWIQLLGWSQPLRALPRNNTFSVLGKISLVLSQMHPSSWGLLQTECRSLPRCSDLDVSNIQKFKKHIKSEYLISWGLERDTDCRRETKITTKGLPFWDMMGISLMLITQWFHNINCNCHLYITPYPVFQPREEQKPRANYGWGQ